MNYTFVSTIDRFKLPEPEAPSFGTYEVNSKDVGKMWKKANYVIFFWL